MNPRVVLDTNVLISGLLGGTATEVIRRWRGGAFDLIVSEEIVSEYEQVLKRPKFKLPEWVVQELLDYIRSEAQWVEPHSIIESVVRDPFDAKFLEAAIAGHADWIVSGDKDLLDLGQFETVAIVSLREFLLHL
jgi:putative PIN family toxin of toxin-antitoxin system